MASKLLPTLTAQARPHLLRISTTTKTLARASSSTSFATRANTTTTTTTTTQKQLSSTSLSRQKIQPPSPFASKKKLNLGGTRWSTTSATGSKIYTFDEANVREPNELCQTGRIPTAKNLPITTSPDSFHLSPEEFADRFHFDQPAKSHPLIFYCKAGVRSRAAAAMAREAGWSDVGEYPGSWLEWSAKGGDVER